jgi:HAD superfamily phosphoserine phosphatase-like hydrolase
MRTKAGFFRVEGTLTPRPSIATAAWLAGNAQAAHERLLRLGNVALAAPFLGGPLRDAASASRVLWMGLRGISEDRLVVLGEEYAERFVIPSLREVGLALVEQARASGHRIVLVSDNLDVVMRHVFEHLGVDDLVCNSMEIRDGKATGRLHDPVIGGHVTVDWARRFAAENGIDLGASSGYGAQAEDGMLLASLGMPCAVHPDWQLRRMARDLSWPVVEGKP